jgi:hypothetical protein
MEGLRSDDAHEAAPLSQGNEVGNDDFGQRKDASTTCDCVSLVRGVLQSGRSDAPMPCTAMEAKQDSVIAR